MRPSIDPRNGSARSPQQREQAKRAGETRRGASAELRFASRRRADIHLRSNLPPPTEIVQSNRAAESRLALERTEAALAAARERQAAANADLLARVGLQSTIEAGSQPTASTAPASVTPPCAAPAPRYGPIGPVRGVSPIGSVLSSAPPPRRSSSPRSSSSSSEANPAETAPKPRDRRALTKNPRKLRYHSQLVAKACTLLQAANVQARKGVEQLQVPARVWDVCHDICDDTGAVAGALTWIRKQHGPAVAIECEAAALYRMRGGVQVDDWACARARRKLALLTFLLMSPHALKRSDVTGSTSDEPMLVTAGVPETLLVTLTRSAQRDPYAIRTLQRDFKEIDLCTDLLLRWRTPVAKAEAWEARGREHGVINRYCIRAGMIRDSWRRARDATEAAIKHVAIAAAAWMCWRPAPARGSPVAMDSGGFVGPPAPA